MKRKRKREENRRNWKMKTMIMRRLKTMREPKTRVDYEMREDR